MSEKKTKKPEIVTVDVDAFIARKMKAINLMENKAKARYLAERLTENRKGRK